MTQIYLLMIIPDNLSAMPVLPVSNEGEPKTKSEADGFVSDTVVREILVGPMMVTPLVTEKVPDEESFAGRGDLPEDSGFVALTSDEAYPDESHEEPMVDCMEPGEPHPALAEPRHAAPPVPRTQCRHGEDLHRRTERWWVLGMGAAMFVLFGLGTLTFFLTGETVGHAQETETVERFEMPPVTFPGSESVNGSQPLAISNPEYPAP